MGSLSEFKYTSKLGALLSSNALGYIILKRSKKSRKTRNWGNGIELAVYLDLNWQPNLFQYPRLFEKALPREGFLQLKPDYGLASLISVAAGHPGKGS
jgi:hypothetical protein